MQAGPGSRDVTETSVGTRYKKEVAKAASFFYCACEHSTCVLPLTQHSTCVLYLI